MATVYRRGRTWWGRVQREGHDLRQSLKTSSKAVAQQRLRAWLEELDRVAWGGKPRRTFDEMAVKFIDEHLPTLKPRAAARYVVSIERLTDSFEGKLLDEIGSAALAEFAAKRRRDGVARRGKGKIPVIHAISPASIRRDLACLSSMFGCAIDWEWTEVNPVGPYLRRQRKRGSLRESPPRTRYLSHDEEARLLAKASPYVAVAIAFAIDTGLRVEEQFALERAQLSSGRVTVTAATSKNSRARTVPLLPRSARLSAQIPPHLRCPFVFVNPQTQQRYRNLDKGFRAAARRAGIRDLRWHDLRRTCGCRLLQDKGFSLEQVKDWLGHSSVKVTERTYAFLRIDDLERALAAAAPKPPTRRAKKLATKVSDA